MTRPHLIGMGVIGCYLALRLEREGVPFTWHDTEDPVNAWRACTGAIFPTGHADDLNAMAVWRDHLTDDAFAAHMEEGSYVFSSKHPPHGGTYAPYRVSPELQSAPMTSLHLNAQTWVPAVRERFAMFRADHPRRSCQHVIAHGFGPRLERYTWGWTAPVRLTFRTRTPRRRALYVRQGRFVMAYAYPIPGTDAWYAGSSLISQRVPKRLAVPPKYARWRDTLRRLAGPELVNVQRAGPFFEGWRPVPHEPGPWVQRMPDGTLAVRPLWHSGVRHAPLVADQLMEML